jgi:hypothetical protein
VSGPPHGPNRTLLLVCALGAVAVALVTVLLVVGLGSNEPDRERAGASDTRGHTKRARRQGHTKRARLFAPDSVWNAPLAASAPLDPASDMLVQKLQDTVAQNIADQSGPWIQTSDSSTPLYIVPASQPAVRVRVHTGWWGRTLQTALKAVPIPDDAAPAAGPDRHITIWQPSKDRLWELFKARRLADGWHADFGGAIARVSRSPGYYTKRSWPPLSRSYWGATATSLPVVGGTMLLDELKSGVIPHALAMNIPFARPKVFSWPAQRTDGTSPDPNAIPEGARFRLDPELDIGKLDLPPMTRMMAEAAQRYGIIVRDQTAHAVAFFGEDPARFGTDPYKGKGGFYGGPDPGPVAKAFPWEHLQLLKMELRTVR